jgi:hypothetical protein
MEVIPFSYATLVQNMTRFKLPEVEPNNDP